MNKLNFKYIYGPVQSWCMGKSLGIDPLSDTAKICNLDCIYCQLGRTNILTDERKEYVPAEKIIREIQVFFDTAGAMEESLTRDIDYLTFSGRGEPTLAKNLGAMIKGTREIRGERIAVITNSTWMYLPEVREDLFLSDLVVAKLDACNEESFLEIDKAMEGISFKRVVEGIKDFKKSYQGKLAIRVMFVEDNLRYVKRIVDLVEEINPQEIQLDTPLRPSITKPLNEKIIEEIKKYFSHRTVVSVYEGGQKKTVPWDEQDTIKRHGNYKKMSLIY